MAICACGEPAKYLLCGRWFCEECMWKALDNPVPATLRRNVVFFDEENRAIHAPVCSICHDRIADLVISETAFCPECSAAKKEFPDADEFNGSLDAAEKKNGLYKGASIIDFPDEYVCVDVETTGRSYSEDEIIEIAALHVKNGAVCDTFTSLVKPSCSHIPWTYAEIQERGYTSFFDVPYSVFRDLSNRRILPGEIVELTGITDDMLRDAPAIDEVIPKFWEFVGDHILVGHNAVFDVSFLCLACQTCGRLLKNDYVDTLRLARSLLPELSNHKLSSLAEHFNITNETAHRAESDALTTAKCLEAMKALVLQTTTVSEFRRDFSDPAWKPSARSLKKLYAQKRIRPSELAAPGTVDPSHPLCGKSIVFTGELHMPRADAAQMAADVGAVVKTDVSSKTDFLVVGRQDRALVGASGTSARERKAQKINDSGKGSIQILTEQDFLRLAGPRLEAGVL